MNSTVCLKKIAIIPLYNDTGNLLKVLPKFADGIVDMICVVVDCPAEEDLRKIEDQSSKIGTPVHIVRNGKRQGVGHAIRGGIEYALENRYDIAVIMAGNNKDDPGEIPRLLRPILEDDCDYVQGSRFLPGGKHTRTPFLRGAFSWIFPFLWTLLTGVRCTEVTNGFRAYKLGIISNRRIDISQSWLDGYQLEYYLHFKVLTNGYKATEVPVSKKYEYRHRGGYSHINPFRDWWGIVSPLIYLKLGARR